MNKLYIIGNGFDLEHNLETSYWDFRKFLDGNYPDFLLEFEKMYNIHPLDPTEPWYKESDQKKWEEAVGHNLWSDFETEIGTPNTDEMLDFSMSVLSDMSLDGGNTGIIDTMDIYWKETYGFVSSLQEHVNEWAMQIDISKKLPKNRMLINNSDDYFFTFNYTDVLETVYNIDKSNILHVHGGLESCCEVSPIIGHGNTESIKHFKKCANEAGENFYEGEESINNAISNFLSTTLKDTNSRIVYNRPFFKQLKEIREVLIIGVSFGKVDVPYLTEIENSINKDSIWKVYWYDEQGRENILKVLNDIGIAKKNLIDIPSSEFWNM